MNDELLLTLMIWLAETVNILFRSMGELRGHT